MLTLQNTTYQSLTKCSVHQAAYKNVQKHTSINHTLAAWCQHLWNKHCKTAPCQCITYYAALLLRRGPHIASHSVCLSVCPSVPWLFTLEHRSRVSVNLADVRNLLFCLHVRAAYCTAISAAQACFIEHYTNNSNSGSGQDK